jgi:pyruvate dehydrogenase E2 component (dihydrolipoamide acetyltransferase)
MAIEIRMPKLSDTMEEGTILRWFKQIGDDVRAGEPLAEVETDKADMEVEAETGGKLTEIRVEEGQAAGVGAVIAVLEEGRRAEGKEERNRAGEGKEASDAGAGAGRGAAANPAAAAEAEDEADEESALSRREGSKRTKSAAAGASVGDVKAAAPPPRPRPSVPPPAAAPRRDGDRERDARPAELRPELPRKTAARAGRDRQEVSKLRATVAKQMTSSKREVPHFYVTAEVDMSEAARVRQELVESEAFPERVTFTHLLLRALALTLPDHPRVNASWGEGEVTFHEDVNIGVAVAVEDGLIAPVLRRCQNLSLRQIARAVSELVGKAQAGRFSGDELTGATITLSNLGMLDVEEFSAVITQPQAAIIAVGAIKERPVVRDGQIRIAKTMRLTLSADHRVLNGMEAGRFLEGLKHRLEHPVLLIMAAE